MHHVTVSRENQKHVHLLDAMKHLGMMLLGVRIRSLAGFVDQSVVVLLGCVVLGHGCVRWVDK